MKPEYKKKSEFVDDGRTVASMDFDTLGGYHRGKKPNVNYREKSIELSDLNLTGKERWAITKAIYGKLIPFVFIMFATFIAVFFILSLIWKLL